MLWFGGKEGIFFFFFGERACWAVDAFGTCIGIFFLLLLRLRVFNFFFLYIFLEIETNMFETEQYFIFVLWFLFF